MRPPPAASLDDLIRAIWLSINDARPGMRIVLGRSGTTLSRVAYHSLDSMAKFLAFQRALGSMVKHGDPLSRAWLREDGDELVAELKKLQAAPPKGLDAKEIADALMLVENTLKRFAQPPHLRTPSRGPYRGGVFDELRRLADPATPLDDAVKRFENALLRGDPAELRAAANALKQQVGARTVRDGFRKARRLRGEIDSVTEHILKKVQGGDTEQTLRGFFAALDQLPHGDRARKAFGLVEAAAREDSQRWNNVLRVVANASAATTPNQARALVGRVKGALAELLARQLRAYRRLWSEQLHRARLLTASPLLGPGWEVLPIRREVSATTKSGGMGLFYDDAIFLVNRTTDPPKAITAFASQVKSGKWSSGQVAKQINRDIAREGLSGTVKIDGVPFMLMPSPEPPVRAFIGVESPPGEAREAFEFIILPLDGRDLERFARTMLEADGKVPIVP